MKTKSPSRGITLLECLIYCAVLVTVAAFSMRALGEARLVRDRGAERNRLAIIAQEQLDQLRLQASELEAGTETLTSEDWPSATTVTTTVTARTEDLFDLEVIVTRETLDGPLTVQLATLVRGAAS